MINSIKSKKTISIILTIILLLFTTSVYAANDSFNTSLSVNKSSVEQGENVIVTINISDISIESGEKGIGAYTAKLDFDSSVLEYVETNGTDKWEAPFYQDKQITGTTADGKVVDTNQNIGTITFKVKENAPVGETTIKLTNFSGSTAETDVMMKQKTEMEALLEIQAEAEVEILLEIQTQAEAEIQVEAPMVVQMVAEVEVKILAEILLLFGTI